MAEIIERTCIVCGGSGEFSNGKPCRACDGEGSRVFFKPYPKEENTASPKSGDRILGKLKRAVEKRQRAYLWTPSDAITFVPRVLPKVFGDGRALFSIATINQRPAYWVVRACSTWGCGSDREQAPGPDFGEMTDGILTALEDAFGRGRCGYSGNSLFWSRKERMENCQCEECADRIGPAQWPMVDDNGGCSWGRMKWPEGFRTVPNPYSWRGNFLAVSRTGKRQPSPTTDQVRG